uniref:Uncharacterized protein n=1 Tax=uncultured euryarchaeote Alv-FOS4 TaxID=337893 RepID=Q3SA69_9EURY|nr:hypothetical protein [uncultured euryarchaeote Alv-FOS4]
MIGNSQGYDDSGDNVWFNEYTEKGNYWSNWDGKDWGTSDAYTISGSAEEYDMFPQGPANPVPEFSSAELLCVILIFAGIVAIRTRKSVL